LPWRMVEYLSQSSLYPNSTSPDARLTFTISKKYLRSSESSTIEQRSDKRKLRLLTKTGWALMQSFSKSYHLGRISRVFLSCSELKLRNLFCYRAVQGLDKLLNGSNYSVCISFRDLVVLLGFNNVNQVLKRIDDYMVFPTGIRHCPE
jgi:hypothetical protein